MHPAPRGKIIGAGKTGFHEDNEAIFKSRILYLMMCWKKVLTRKGAKIYMDSKNIFTEKISAVQHSHNRNIIISKRFLWYIFDGLYLHNYRLVVDWYGLFNFRHFCVCKPETFFMIPIIDLYTAAKNAIKYSDLCKSDMQLVLSLQYR